ncbi:hypothetical protein QEH59_08030 [Coraliomargarita sp. SDUM461004]|uniref:Outer membrane lipoprotein-sorting protein n=1 Tax=Thalassobacterium sedimentorum TaxID=3041258 RepID=A0ABU1AHV8_9BACT|nr:hypothetical protein [Coraliomargarita sp. SDUM461004]MDQ8194370.1 hypothetical protein [Coraliomargarita sp. SDUM461004]
MILQRHLLCFLAAFGMSAVLLVAADEREGGGDTLLMPAQLSEALRVAAMPELQNGRLAKILTRYYKEGLGGAEAWSQISSFKVTGTLKLKEGEFELKAYQKKPNLMKMSIRGDHDELVLAYDGDLAWQKLPGRNSMAEPMAAAEARRFKHSAIFGSYLLYPYAEGKTIEYIDTVPTDATISHQIRVTLDSGYQVDYFIDIRSYLEVKSIKTDLQSGAVSEAIFRDYVREEGMPIARQVESYEDGEWVSSLMLEEVKVNAGVIPWMFKMRR